VSTRKNCFVLFFFFFFSFSATDDFQLSKRSSHVRACLLFGVFPQKQSNPPSTRRPCGKFFFSPGAGQITGDFSPSNVPRTHVVANRSNRRSLRPRAKFNTKQDPVSGSGKRSIFSRRERMPTCLAGSPTTFAFIFRHQTILQKIFPSGRIPPPLHRPRRESSAIRA